MISNSEFAVTENLSERLRVSCPIALASLNWYREKDPRTALGLAFIGSYLLENVSFTGSNNLHLLEYDVRDNLTQLLHQIVVINPKVIGLGVYIWNDQQTKQLLQDLRATGYNGIIVLGGPQISYGDERLKEEYPETKWLILLANKDEGNNADYVEQAKNLKNELEDNQKEFPDNFKKTINVIDISDVASDYVKMFQFTLKLFDLIIKKDYKISINGSSGLQLLQIVLYQIALIKKDYIIDYFVFNKRNKFKQIIWLQRDLDKNDIQIMEILSEKESMNISEIQVKFNEISGKGQISYVTKLVQRLSAYNLITEEKVGREKFIKLKEIGKVLINQYHYDNLIKFQ